MLDNHVGIQKTPKTGDDYDQRDHKGPNSFEIAEVVFSTPNFPEKGNFV